jgi:hypothetical protein
MIALLVTKKPHPVNDGFFDDLIGHGCVGNPDRPHDIESPVSLKVSVIAVVVFYRKFFIAKAGGQDYHQHHGHVQLLHKMGWIIKEIYRKGIAMQWFPYHKKNGLQHFLTLK